LISKGSRVIDKHEYLLLGKERLMDILPEVKVSKKIISKKIVVVVF